MVGAVEGVVARVLEVGPKRDRVGGRAIRGKPQDQQVTSGGHRSGIDRS